MKSTVIFEGPVNVPVKAKSGCLGCTFHVSYPIISGNNEVIGYYDMCALVRDKEGRHEVADEIDCPISVLMTDWGKEP